MSREFEQIPGKFSAMQNVDLTTTWSEANFRGRNFRPDTCALILLIKAGSVLGEPNARVRWMKGGYFWYLRHRKTGVVVAISSDQHLKRPSKGTSVYMSCDDPELAAAITAELMQWAAVCLSDELFQNARRAKGDS